MSLQVHGLLELIERLFDIKQLGDKVLNNTLEELGYKVLKLSKAEYVPVDTGNLRSSGEVEVKRVDKVIVMYTAQYALAVHERTDEDVNWSKKGTGPKYLRKAFNEVVSARRASEILLDRLMDAIS